jgi:hypothetical protein
MTQTTTHPELPGFTFYIDGRIERPDGTFVKDRVVCNGKRKYIHVLNYEAWYGRVPDSCLIMHHDEMLPMPWLHSPGNLNIGTDKLNAIDRQRKNRGKKQDGELNSSFKMTDEVKAIARTSDEPLNQLGARLGIHPATLGKYRTKCGLKSKYKGT